jgi:chemotaxis protein MotB
MAGMGDAPVIRIVKKKKGHGGHHGGAWKVAYADFVTAMMAFFLVMWIVGLSKPVKEAISQYFRNPPGIMQSGKGGVNPMASVDKVELNGKAAPLIPADGGAGSADQLAVQFKKLQEAILKELEKTPEFRGLRESIQVHLTNEGLRIELMEKTSSLFFDSGDARLKPRTVRLLAAISKQLKTLKNPIIVEGHTDSRPLGRAGGYSNWELSTDRANTARRAMQGAGIPSEQILAVRGYADKKLLRPDDPTHFSNRRVSILMAYTGKDK